MSKPRVSRAAGASPGRDAVPVSEYDEAWIRETWGFDDAEEFVRSAGANLRPRVRRALELAEVGAGMRVLDVGCGRGEVVLECARRGADAVGVDYSAPAIALAGRARARCDAAAQARARFFTCDVHDLPGDERFDRIFMLDLVEHLHDWQLVALFNAVRARLNPGGLVMIHTLPNRWVYEVSYRRLVRPVLRFLPAEPRNAKEKAIHVNEMSVTHLDQLLRHCGLEGRVWLEEQITAQARWHAAHPLSGARGKLYRLMQNRAVAAAYRVCGASPLKLLVVNDIFGVAWAPGTTPSVRLPGALTERLVCAAARRLAPWTFSAGDEKTRR